MGSGGARARPGPPPDPNALRRDRNLPNDQWVTLPAEGRSGEAPQWPLIECSERERELWDLEWQRPQAVEWERSNSEVEVALYVRRLVEAEVPGSSVPLGTLIRQMQEGLGISLNGMLKYRWKVAGVDYTADKSASVNTAGKNEQGSSRSRMRVVPS